MGNPAAKIDLFNARKLLMNVLREVSGERRTAPPAGETAEEKSARERAEAAKALSRFFVYTPQHVPGGVVMQKVSQLTYLTPNGPKQVTRTQVEATLRDAKRSFITDLLEGSSVDPGDAADEDGSGDDGAGSSLQYMRVDAAEALRGYTYQELDEMRFALVAAADLVQRNVFDAEGRISGLAKRDLKKHFPSLEESAADAKKPKPKISAAEAASVPASSKKGKTPGVITAPTPAAQVDKPQKNLKPLLFDQCQTLWPYTPPDKSAVFATENDPARPRHKPLYRCTVSVAAIKRKFEGEWMPTKRDAENAAAEKALGFLSHYKPK